MTTRAEREAKARELRSEGLLFREIAEVMGVAASTVDAWINDPGGSKLRSRKDGYRGECDTCGGPTDGSNGPGRASVRCITCRMWTPEAILEALRAWGDDHGGIPPREIDARVGMEGHGRLPYETTVRKLFGSWNAGLLAAGYEGLHQDKRPETTQAMADAIRAGKSTEEVGDMFGVSASAVRMRLRYHGMRVSELRSAA